MCVHFEETFEIKLQVSQHSPPPYRALTVSTLFYKALVPKHHQENCFLISNVHFILKLFKLFHVNDFILLFFNQVILEPHALTWSLLT